MFRTPSRLPEEVTFPTSSHPSGAAPGRISAPTRGQQRVLRGLILIGLLQICFFLFWYIDPRHIGYLPLFLLLSFSLGFRLFRLLHEWYHYWSLTTPYRPPLRTDWQVDVVTTYCAGEPKEMVKESLMAMLNIRYPHQTWLCDEANDPELRAFCEQHGIHHHYRGPQKKDAKAGNINHALPLMQGDIIAILDPDHQPVPAFLDRLLPYFEEDRIGYVQSIQAYHNLGESMIARGAAEQTFHFYGPMMMSMNSYGTVQAIGANCVFRRAALDDIGGHASGLAEDMHTAIQLQAKGWESVYHPEALTQGEVPANLSAYYQQQLKWSRGTLEILVKTWPRLVRKLSWRQAFHYASLPLHFAFCLVFLADLLLPVLALFQAEVPLTASLSTLLLLAFPIMISSLIIRQYVQRWVRNDQERGLHLLGGILYLGTWWVHLLGLVCTLLRIPIPYLPTPKRTKPQNARGLSFPNFMVMLLSLAAISVGLSLDWSPYSFMMAGFALINAIILGVVIGMSQQRWGNKHLEPVQKPASPHPLSRLLRQSAWAISVSLLIGAASLIAWSLPVGSPDMAIQQVERVPSPAYYWGGYAPGLLSDSLQTDGGKLSGNLQALQVDSTHDFSFLVGEKRPQGALLLDWPVQEFVDSTSYIAFLNHIIAGDWDERFNQLGSLIQQHSQPVFLNFLPAPSRWLRPNDRALIRYQQAYTRAVSVIQEQGASPLVWAWEVAQDSPHGLFKPREAQLIICPLEHKLTLTTLPTQSLLLKGTAVQWDRTEAIPVSEAHLLGGVAVGSPSTGILARYTPEAGVKGKNAIDWIGQRLRASESLPVWEVPPIPIPSAPQDFSDLSLPLQGVVYNSGQSWEDGHVPLVRKQLQQDFEAIKAMGANTIRRGKSGIYAHNILSQAAEHGLQVLWDISWEMNDAFFFQEKIRLQQKAAILEQVRKLHTYPALKAWGLGDQAFEELRQRLSPDLLPYAERILATFIGEVASAMKDIDPVRPVYTILETGKRLGPKLALLQAYAPRLDMLGLNQLAGVSAGEVNPLLSRYWSGRPVFSSGFGPTHPLFLPDSLRDDQGYWPEASPYEKALAYQQGWAEAMALSESWGGLAFSWRNRMTGSAIWYGLTDLAGRKTPAYHILQQSWSGRSAPLPLPDIYLTPPWSLPDFAFYRLVTPALNHEDISITWSVRDQWGQAVSLPIVTDEKQHHAYIYGDRKRNLRVYVSLTDAQGNVTQTSAPIW